MKCLVTGGCGFIGSHVVDQLVDLGHECLVLDDLSTSDGTYLNPAATLVKGSVTDASLVRSVTEGVDWLFHTAAWARVPRSIDDPIGTHNVNVTGTLNVLQSARENGVGRIINSSSSSVYGDQPNPVMREDMLPTPKSPYALHNLISEQYATMFACLFDMQIISLRYFNVYGPRHATEGAYVMVISKFMRLRALGKPLTIYGSGNQTRSYTYVADVVRASLLAATAELPSGQHTILNIGSDEETSVNEIAAIIGGEVEHVIPNPRSEFEEFRKSADYTRARAMIGWYPQVPLAEGLRDTIAHFPLQASAR